MPTDPFFKFFLFLIIYILILLVFKFKGTGEKKVTKDCLNACPCEKKLSPEQNRKKNVR